MASGNVVAEKNEQTTESNKGSMARCPGSPATQKDLKTENSTYGRSQEKGITNFNLKKIVDS